MALTQNRTYTWQDLIDDSVTWSDTNPWVEWTGNGTTIDGSTGYADLVYTTSVQDLGVTRTFFPTCSALTNGTHSIAVETSANGTTGWTAQTLGAITARYVRFVITVTNATETASLSSFETELFFDPIEETFNAFSVGATNTALPIAKNYSSILGIRYDAPANFQVVLTDTTASAPGVTSYDLDTWGKIASATTANVTVIGFPNVSADSNGNIVIS